MILSMTTVSYISNRGPILRARQALIRATASGASAAAGLRSASRCFRHAVATIVGTSGRHVLSGLVDESVPIIAAKINDFGEASQFRYMNCRMFSRPFSSGERRGNGSSEMLADTFRSLAPRHST
jgi:hypothetical protein